jgi:hypothetical protein
MSGLIDQEKFPLEHGVAISGTSSANTSILSVLFIWVGLSRAPN